MISHLTRCDLSYTQLVKLVVCAQSYIACSGARGAEGKGPQTVGGGTRVAAEQEGKGEGHLPHKMPKSLSSL